MFNLTHIVETAALIFVAYQLGWFIGFLARRMTSRTAKPSVIPAERMAIATGEMLTDPLVKTPVVDPIAAAPIPGKAEPVIAMSHAAPPPVINLAAPLPLPPAAPLASFLEILEADDDEAVARTIIATPAIDPAPAPVAPQILAETAEPELPAEPVSFEPQISELAAAQPELPSEIELVHDSLTATPLEALDFDPAPEPGSVAPPDLPTEIELILPAAPADPFPPADDQFDTLPIAPPDFAEIPEFAAVPPGPPVAAETKAFEPPAQLDLASAFEPAPEPAIDPDFAFTLDPLPPIPEPEPERVVAPAPSLKPASRPGEAWSGRPVPPSPSALAAALEAALEPELDEESAAMRAIEGGWSRAPRRAPEIAADDPFAPPPPVIDPAPVASEPELPAFGRPNGLVAPRPEGKDNLRQIKGLGAADESALNDLGFFHFDQLAAWDQKAIVWLETNRFGRGRVQREKWIDQARDLAKSRPGLRFARR